MAIRNRGFLSTCNSVFINSDIENEIGATYLSEGDVHLATDRMLTSDQLVEIVSRFSGSDPRLRSKVVNQLNDIQHTRNSEKISLANNILGIASSVTQLYFLLSPLF